MTTGVLWFALGAIVVLLGLSAFFSSSESAIFSLAPTWRADHGGGDDRRGAILMELRDDPHRLLVTILVGNNVVNIAISSIVTVALVGRISGPSAVAAATVIASFVVLVFGEIIPKSYGLGNAESWALVVARPLTIVEIALYPLVTGFDLITRTASSLLGGDQRIERPYTKTTD